MTKKEKNKKEAIATQTQNHLHLGKDLRKTFFLTGSLILLVVILALIDNQTQFLTKFSQSLITKLVGK